MELLTKEKHYLLGCSGGPDSMALFHMLLANNINFDVAFVNYHKRKESVVEEEAVRNYCKKNNIKFHLLSAKEEVVEGNFQAWAREFRYDFFKRLVKEYNYDSILIAHHKDDLLETYIFQKTRGGIYSYYGLKKESTYKGIKVLRPLLAYRKDDLLEYCKKNNVPYFIDSSNLKDDYSRNKIRHEIVSKLSDTQIEEILSEIEKDNLINKEEKNKANNYLKNGNGNVEEFLKLEDKVCQRVLFMLCSEYKVDISGREIKAIIDFLSSSKNGELQLVEDIFVFKDYESFYISNKSNFEYEYIIEKECVFDNEFIYLDLINGKKELFIKGDPYPLKVCKPKKDEVVRIGNIDKKVNRLFIDEKISNKDRSIWPVIKDKNGKIIFFPRKKEKKSNNKLVFKIKI